MLFSNLDEQAFEEELIQYCADPPDDHVLSSEPFGNKVVQISTRAVVKFGVGVTQAEAVNQAKAYRLVDPQIVRVPKVHRYFSDNEGRGYIVMDLIEGKIIEPLEDPTQATTIAHILDHLASFGRGVPGPLGFGQPGGLLFLDEREAAFTDMEDLERWWNGKLLPGEPVMDLQHSECVLCHLDVAPRNILWKDGEAPGLVDWASAGYYPRSFEFCAQLIMEGKDGGFHSLLLHTLTKLESTDALQVAPLLQAWSNMQRYWFPPRPSRHDSPGMTEPSDGEDEHAPIAGPPLPPYPAGWPNAA